MLKKAISVLTVLFFAVIMLQIGGPGMLVISAGGIIFLAGLNILLRRVLMYLSILRYGAWQEMAPEMRAMLENPTDLALAPARFAKLPRNFTPVGCTGQPQAQSKPSPLKLVGWALIVPFTPLLAMVALTAMMNHLFIVAALVAGAAAIHWRNRRAGEALPHAPPGCTTGKDEIMGRQQERHEYNAAAAHDPRKALGPDAIMVHYLAERDQLLEEVRQERTEAARPSTLPGRQTFGRKGA